MRILSLLIVIMLVSCISTLQAQKYPQKNSGQKIEKIAAVKPDTTDPNRKALNKFSKDNMYNVTKPKTVSPEEQKAMDYYMAGSKKGKEQDYPGAILEFTKSIDLVKNPNAYALRAYSYLMVGNYGAAIVDASETIRLMEGYIKAYFIRGIARYETGDMKNARADLEVFLDHDRTNAIAFNYMAALEYLDKDFKGALENYNEVVRLDPTYPDIYTNRGMMRHHNQDYTGAIQDYNEALKLKPDNLAAYNNRGAAHIMLNEMELALADFDKAISLNPKYADAYDNRGRVKQALGDLDGACEDWNSAYINGLVSSRDLIIKFCK